MCFIALADSIKFGIVILSQLGDKNETVLIPAGRNAVAGILGTEFR